MKKLATYRQLGISPPKESARVPPWDRPGWERRQGRGDEVEERDRRGVGPTGRGEGGERQGTLFE